MKRVLYTIFFILLLCIPSAKGQNVILNADFDSLAICIGQQTRMTLDLTVDAGHDVVMPPLRKDTLTDGIEVLSSNQSHSLVDNGKRERFVQEYLVTSFDTTLYKVPAFEVLVDSVKYPSRSPQLFVYGVDINTWDLDSISPVRGIIDVELTWEDYRDSVYLTVIVAFLVAVLVWMSMLLIKNKPVVRIIKVKPKLPSHIRAMKTIEDIKSDTSLRVPGNEKEYYTKLTDVLRQYMYDRFGFNAPDMTTSEIVRELQKVEDREGLAMLKELLETADLVKFAKMTVSMYENDRSMLNAIEFIDRTKDVEEEKIKQPTELRVVNKRSRKQKYFLIGLVSVLAILLVWLVYLLSTDMYNLIN